MEPAESLLLCMASTGVAEAPVRRKYKQFKRLSNISGPEDEEHVVFSQKPGTGTTTTIRPQLDSGIRCSLGELLVTIIATCELNLPPLQPQNNELHI